jgi:uncharacterized protein
MKEKTCAVIGSGLAGLSAAHILSHKYKVTMLERESKIGMDVASISILDDEKKEIRIDAPMRTIQKTYYPTLYAMYEYLGIEKTTGGYETSWYDWKRDRNVFLSSVKPTFLGIKTDWALIDVIQAPFLSLLVIIEFARLMLHAFYLAASKQTAQLSGTFGEFLKQHHYSDQFLNNFLLPFMVNVGTCTHKSMLGYPASVTLHMISCYSPMFEQVHGGVRTVCDRLTKNVKEIEYQVEIIGAWYQKTTGKIILLDRHGKRTEFDHVIFATQAHVAKKILEAEPPTDLKKSVASPNGVLLNNCLSTFESKPVRVVIHSDSSLMPAKREHWRGLNLTSDGSESMGSMWINFVYRLPANVPDYFETNNIFVEPQPVIPKDKILSEYVFPRSFVTKKSCDGLDLLEKFQGLNGFYFVGSWAWPGMPLLEGCVASSVRVAERLGVRRPWSPAGRECLPWSKDEDLLPTGIVNRFINDELCVEKPRDSLGWKITRPIVFLFIQLYLLIVSTLFRHANIIFGKK